MKSNKKEFNYLLFSFFLVSILFWFIEIGYSLIFRSKFVLPGAWYGPYCPIYGLAFVLILLVFKKNGNVFLNVLKIAITVTVMEYVISFISEVVWNNIIWDYSDKFLNLNGRICLEMSLTFTIIGILMMYFLEPLIKKLYKKMGKSTNYINIILSIIMIIDMMITLI